VIEDYETPPDSTLNRHLPGQYFSHQINYIIAARPMCTAMGNTVRWLKTEISNLSPDLTDEIAKRDLVDKIEGFIHERLLAANDVIINTVCDRYIQDEDVIVTFSKSQVVEKALLEAKERGKNFRVVVVDSRPLEEGRNLLESLCDAGIECSYSSLYALDDLMADATKVFVGAHAMMANGSLYSRAGSSVVSMAASAAGIPVLVLCETIKFSDKINIDGIVNNELGKLPLLWDKNARKCWTVTDRGPTTGTTDSLVNSINGVAGSLKSWEGVQNNTLACFMYDVTPSSCIAAVICEHGCVTPEGVSTVLRISGLER
jgi:translation initiation factor eIF-2B subunit delta